VLAHESAEAFDRFRDEVRALAPEGADDVAVELAADAAASSAARLIRCDKVALERIEQRVRHAADDFDREQKDRADKLGRDLLWEPTARGNHHDNEDDYASERFEARETIDTRALWRELQSFAEGVDWLLGWWETLLETLDSFGTWWDNEAYIACRLLGRDPERATDDPVVARVVTASRVAHCLRDMRVPPVTPITPEALVGSVFGGYNDARRHATNYPVQRDRVEVRYEQLGIVTKEQGQAALRAVVAKETARLRALKSEKLDRLAALDRKSAVVLAEFDDTHIGLLIRRYTTANRREMRQALLDLRNAEPVPETEEEVEAEAKPETEVTPESGAVGFVPSTAPPAPFPAPESPSVRPEPGSATPPRPHQ